MRRVSFYTIGCRLNQAETAILQQHFEQSGFSVLDFADDVDVVVVNTCTVTSRSDTDTRKIVNKIQRAQPGARIALVGCQAQTQKEKLLNLPGVQWVIGNAVKMNLPHVLDSTWNDAPRVLAPKIGRDAFTLPTAGIDRQHTRANLKIQDGCDFYCTFCEIPYARGHGRSRVFDDILREAETLVAAGHKELVLTGINIGTYRYQDLRLLDVITELEKIDGLERIRISSIEGKTVPNALLETMASSDKLCRHLHISLQSGSDAILKAMRRRYTVREFNDFLEKAVTIVENICIGTDVLVGFPGETDDLFSETMETVRSMPFAYFHVFSYSDRDHNKSRLFDGKVDKATKDARGARLREIGHRQRQLYLQKNTGRVERVLFEQQKDGFWTGLTDTFIRVRVESKTDLANQLLPARLESIYQQQMTGTLF